MVTDMSIPKLWERAEPVPYSSVVGQSVLLFHESGKVTCQLSLIGCELDRTGQTWLAQMLCDALNAYQSDTELARLRAENAELVEERNRWREAAQAATPGGSEFCEPNAVRDFLQAQRRDLVGAKMEIVRLERAALAKHNETKGQRP